MKLIEFMFTEISHELAYLNPHVLFRILILNTTNNIAACIFLEMSVTLATKIPNVNGIYQLNFPNIGFLPLNILSFLVYVYFL